MLYKRNVNNGIDLPIVTGLGRCVIMLRIVCGICVGFAWKMEREYWRSVVSTVFDWVEGA